MRAVLVRHSHRLPLIALIVLMSLWAAYQTKSALGIDLLPKGGLHMDLGSIARAFERHQTYWGAAGIVRRWRH